MPGYVVQVVAHPDDDLFFANPDVQAAISAGLPAVTVYVTAGQLSGNGSTDGQRARNRQFGVQAAYAQMAGVAAPQWVGDVLWAGRRQVERYTLVNAPQPVELVFGNLPDGGLAAVDGGQSRTTVVVEGGQVARTFSYARADVVAMLAALMCRYQPSVLHSLDPLPDSRYTADHTDHVAAARIAGDAAVAYSDSLPLVNHRCYNVQDAPSNLDQQAVAAKTAPIDTYRAYDSSASGAGWIDRMYHRWPRGSSWMGHNADGRLQLFVVRSGALWTWWQAPGGGWVGPQLLGGAGGPIAPTVGVAPNADGRLQVFGRRLDNHRIVTVYQTAVNGGWATTWADLGNPNLAYGNADQVGAPAATLLGNGRILLAVKNGGGGVSAKQQSAANDGWPSPWADLGGTDVQDGLAASTNPAGCIELVAVTRTGVLHWYQDYRGGPIVLNSAFPAFGPASPPSAALAADGAATVAYRAVGGEVAVNQQTTPAGGWAAAVVVAGRPGPTGPAVSGGQPTLVSRGADGRVSVGRPVGGSWTWTDLDGPPVIDTPSAALDSSGAVVLAAVGMDGAVRVRTQVAAGAGQPFGPWQALPAWGEWESTHADYGLELDGTRLEA